MTFISFDLCNIEPEDMGGNVKETRNTVAFIGSLIWTVFAIKQRKYLYWTIKGSISNLWLYFHSFSYFSKLRFPPWVTYGIGADAKRICAVRTDAVWNHGIRADAIRNHEIWTDGVRIAGIGNYLCVKKYNRLQTKNFQRTQTPLRPWLWVWYIGVFVPQELRYKPKTWTS